MSLFHVLGVPVVLSHLSKFHPIPSSRSLTICVLSTTPSYELRFPHHDVSHFHQRSPPLYFKLLTLGTCHGGLPLC